jgi:hypothetical protein
MKPRTGFVPSITAVPSNPPPPHHCAGQRKDRSPACGLQAATVSGAEPRRHAIRLRHGFVTLAIAVSPAPTFVVTPNMVTVGPPPAPSAMKLPTAPAATPGGAHRPTLRGPPPLNCVEADGCDAWCCSRRRSNPISSRCSIAPSRAGVNRKRLNITAHYPK